MSDFFIKIDQTPNTIIGQILGGLFNVIGIPAQVFGWVYLVTFTIKFAWGS